MSGEPAWQRPLPAVSLPPKVGPPLEDPVHRAFHFFLTLCARELWSTDQGYGLADPGSGATVTITGQGIIAHHRQGEASASERLCARLFEIIDRWKELGRPDLEDWELRFVPKEEFPVLETASERVWTIERVFFREEVSLARSIEGVPLELNL